MLRINDTYAILAAPFMPPITVEVLNDKQIAIDGALIDTDGISFDQAIKMVEESAQANLGQALLLLARKLKGPWKAGEYTGGRRKDE